MWISVIVLNWNQPDLTLQCLQSLAVAAAVAPIKITVIDNGSTDDSVARIHSAYPDVGIVAIGANLGYAGGNNVGIRYALATEADFICILNNDVVVEKTSLTALASALEASPHAGVATPLITDAENTQTVWALGASLDWETGYVSRLYADQPVSRFASTQPFDVDIAPGSAMMARRAVFERAGLLDESFFLYYEEVDWCISVKEAGFRIIGVPEAVVTHYVSASLGQSSPVTDYYMTRNRIWFIRRHWTGFQQLRLVLRDYAEQVARVIAYSARPCQGKKLPHRNARLYAIRDSLMGKWGRMGDDVARVCYTRR